MDRFDRHSLLTPRYVRRESATENTFVPWSDLPWRVPEGVGREKANKAPDFVVRSHGHGKESKESQGLSQEEASRQEGQEVVLALVGAIPTRKAGPSQDGPA